MSRAIRSQNAQVAAGRIGAQPNPITPADLGHRAGQGAALVAGGIRRRSCCAPIRTARLCGLRDVARVEVGGESYNFSTRLNGKPTRRHRRAAVADRQRHGDVRRRSRRRMDELSAFFPAGLEYSIPYDTSPFVKVSIEKVLHTLLEAMVLVFLVMFLFLQNIRYTIIPTLVVPVALLGTCARDAGDGLLDQRADHVRHGAGDRHSGRRRDRRRRERRAHHGGGGAVAARKRPARR